MHNKMISDTGNSEPMTSHALGGLAGGCCCICSCS